MDIKRAVFSFLIAALAPGVVALVTSPIGEAGILTGVVVFGVWYLFSIPIIFPVGFLTLFLSLRVKWGAFFLPPLIGCTSGFVIGKIMYAQGTEFRDMLLLVLDGGVTAIVAALLYFWPWSKQSSIPTSN